MRHPLFLFSAIGLLLLGALGIAWLQVEVSPSWRYRSDFSAGELNRDSDAGRVRERGRLGDVELGERVYRYGVGEDERPVPRTAVGPGMMGAGCSACHGDDGRGGPIRMMMFSFEAPDIRLPILHGGKEGQPWTRSDVERAIAEGVEPDGERLDEFMPRWDLSADEMDALLGYLGRLDER